MVRRAASEALGAAFLLMAVVGFGIMGERLSGGNLAIALLANTLAVGAALVALIVLVHRVNVICKSRCDPGSSRQRYVCWNSPNRRSRLHRC